MGSKTRRFVKHWENGGFPKKSFYYRPLIQALKQVKGEFAAAELALWAKCNGHDAGWVLGYLHRVGLASRRWVCRYDPAKGHWRMMFVYRVTDECRRQMEQKV